MRGILFVVGDGIGNQAQTIPALIYLRGLPLARSDMDAGMSRRIGACIETMVSGLSRQASGAPEACQTPGPSGSADGQGTLQQ